jgi:hypothetical protein
VMSMHVQVMSMHVQVMSMHAQVMMMSEGGTEFAVIVTMDASLHHKRLPRPS